MRDAGAVLSGLAALAMFHPDLFDLNDLDFYVPHQGFSSFLSFVQDHGYRVDGNSLTDTFYENRQFFVLKLVYQASQKAINIVITVDSRIIHSFIPHWSWTMLCGIVWCVFIPNGLWTRLVLSSGIHSKLNFVSRNVSSGVFWSAQIFVILYIWRLIMSVGSILGVLLCKGHSIMDVFWRFSRVVLRTWSSWSPSFLGCSPLAVPYSLDTCVSSYKSPLGALVLLKPEPPQFKARSKVSETSLFGQIKSEWKYLQIGSGCASPAFHICNNCYYHLWNNCVVFQKAFNMNEIYYITLYKASIA